MNSPSVVQDDHVEAILERAFEAGDALPRLNPTWVPRSTLKPGKRMKLNPDHDYAYGTRRGGIDERWFGSTTDAANEGRVWHEEQSFCSFEGEHFLLKDAVTESGETIVGKAIWEKNQRCPLLVTRKLDLPRRSRKACHNIEPTLAGQLSKESTK